MAIIIILISISLLIAVLFLGIFYWNVKSGQYDDTYTPSVRILFDDKPRKMKLQEKDNIEIETTDADKNHGVG